MQAQHVFKLNAPDACSIGDSATWTFNLQDSNMVMNHGQLPGVPKDS